MLIFSKSCQYALRAAIYLAASSSKDRRIGVTEMAEQLEVPRHFLAKVLQQLSRASLISSVKGPGGGFYMSEANRMEPLINIIECIDGDTALKGCILGLPNCSSDHPCPLHFQVMSGRQGMLYHLEKMTVQDYARIGLNDTN